MKTATAAPDYVGQRGDGRRESPIDRLSAAERAVFVHMLAAALCASTDATTPLAGEEEVPQEAKPPRGNRRRPSMTG